MSQSTALVPIPFYAPVCTGTGLSFNFGEASNGRLLMVPGDRTVSTGPDEGPAYRRDGFLVEDSCIGRIVNLYV